MNFRQWELGLELGDDTCAANWTFPVPRLGLGPELGDEPRTTENQFNFARIQPAAPYTIK